MMRFLRAVRLDESDTRVFERAATPGEWAVPGSFVFLDVDPQTLSGKSLQAFKHGFLGTESFGWTTLVEVAEIEEGAYKGLIERLAHHLVEKQGAPSIAEAVPFARDEAEYTASIAERDLHTLLAIEREPGGDGVVENLRVLRPSAAGHSQVRLWAPDEE